jgi:CubicO group peptidase (beta-lactamase class C family)
MADAGIPGLAVGIVQGHEVLWANGYGVADLRRRVAVTADTRFDIGSCTKSFTATALGLLVEDGKLQWDTPLREILPGLRLHDEGATRAVTPRDLVLHRTGMGRHDLVALTSPATRGQVLRRLRFLSASSPLRSQFAYSNLMYIVAGAVVERVSGQSWEAFIRDRLFGPLGMQQSGFSVREGDGVKDAVGHAWLGGPVVPWLRGWHCGKDIRAAMGRSFGPQGSIRSSARELCRWLLFHLNQGQLDGQVVLKAEQMQELHRPQILIGQRESEPEMLDAAYAMGWIWQPYRGNRWLWHVGAGQGQVASISFMPDRQVGVVVLLNVEKPLSVASVVALAAYDRLLGLDVIDWARRWAPGRRQQEAAAQGLHDRQRCRGMRIGPRAGRAYLGEYRHPGYDAIRVCRSGGRLVLQYNLLRFGLQECGPRAFQLLPQVFLPWWGQRQARFVPGRGGRMRAIVVPFDPEVSFRRRRA